MAKQTVNIGTSANDRTGDNLRSAFAKINANFDELYTELGLNLDTDLNLGAFEFTGSTLTTTDSSAIVIDQAASITGDFTVGGDIVPNVNEEHSLGSSTKRFKDIYLSGSTIDLGGTTLSIVGGKLQVGGADVGSTVSYNEITDTPTIPSALSDLTNDLSDLDNLNAGEGIPDLLTAYTDQSAVVDSLLNAGDYGVDLSPPSDYTFYDLVVAKRAVNPLIPQELEQAALLQLNAYNAWQAEIAADKATITVGDYAWDFKGDGNLSFPDGTTQTTAWTGITDLTGSVFGDDSALLVDGVNSKINLQNTVRDNTISTSDENFFINTAATPGDRGFTNITTTDNILDIQGAAALPGGQGGGIYINGGIPFDDPSDYTRYGDIIISGRTVSILVGDGEGGGGLAIAGPVIGTTVMDIKGSVFGDDSTVLVDGVNGEIPGYVKVSDLKTALQDGAGDYAAFKAWVLANL